MMDEHAFTDVALDVLSEFFEVATHCILSGRKIYPSGIFEPRKKYGIPLQMSIHPELNQYVTNCLKSLRSLLLKDDVSALAIAVLDPSDKAIERYLFEIAQIKEEITPCTHNLAEIERILRAICLKILTSMADLPPLPTGCHFTVQIHTRELTLKDPKMEIVDENSCWIPTEPEKCDLNRPRIIPLKSVQSSLFKLQMFVERSGCD